MLRFSLEIIPCSGNDVVWKEVMELSDSIHVNYSVVEELFASKTIENKESEKNKKPTQVSYTSCVVVLR